MDRLKLKELEHFRLEKEMKMLQHQNVLRSTIKASEAIQIALKYTEDYLRKNKISNLSEYSPVQISRLVFDQQLHLIDQQFKKLPDQEAHIEEFIIIMFKVMNFPFEKTPLYMVGLKDMFYQVAEEGEKTIKYHQLFKYILGELVTMKQEEQNTEFQVRLIERKKQDYLLHDNGIKKVYYSKDLKMIFSLDQRSNSVKFYDQDMKNIAKFSPKKDKHHNRYPQIIDFDYSEITQRLGMVMSDETLSTVHVPNLLNKSEIEFDSHPMNQVVFYVPEKMRKIFFIQMMNKWLTVTEEGNKLFLFDMDRIRTQPDKVQSRLRINLNDQHFLSVLEVVQLSCICVIAGNEVSFYNQNFTQVKFKKFVHCDQIRHFKYSDEKNQFYLCGLQKNITAFTINRSGQPSRIWTFATNKLITDFELFPYFDTVVVADENNDVKLMHQSTRVVFHQINYSHIVKQKDKFLNISKISKNQFSIFQTYMIVMSQQKIAIERDIQYSFLPYYYFDEIKQEMYISVNNQIISFSLMSGQIRKNYSIQTSNLQKHHCIFIGNKCPLFILDKFSNIYEVYQNDELSDGQNKNYRKKINLDGPVVDCFYDYQLGTFIVVGKNNIHQVRNDKNNNFNTLNSIALQGFAPIVLSVFCSKTKNVTVLTGDQLVYQFKNYTYFMHNCIKFEFPKDLTQHQDRFIIGIHYDYLYDVFILFSNKNQIYFVTQDGKNQIYFNIINNMPAKLKQLRFIGFKYQLIKGKKGCHPEPYLLVHDQSGFLVQFSMTQVYQEFGFQIKASEGGMKAMFKDTQTMINEGIQTKIIELNQKNKLKRSYQGIGLMKAHEKQIVIAVKVKLELLVTLTISIDGYIRLWNSKYSLLFSLKIPSLVKIAWNMSEIEDIKNKKSIEELLKIFKQHYHEVLDDHSSPQQVCNKSKRLKKNALQQIPKINHKDPIKVQIQNKDIEDIVMQKEDYKTFYSKQKYKTHGFFHTTSKIYPHPWRKKKQFVQLYEKASPSHKYKCKIPNNLVDMRTSLDMIERIKQKPNFQQAEKLLPQLTTYEPEKGFRGLSQRKNLEKTVDNEQEQTFESCLYVKTQKRKKQINQFDEIDKQFKKKQMLLTARKWVPKKRKDKSSSHSEMKSEIIGGNLDGKVDPLRAIQRIFQDHNRQCLQKNKGRLIRIPKIHINKDMY